MNSERARTHTHTMNINQREQVVIRQSFKRQVCSHTAVPFKPAVIRGREHRQKARSLRKPHKTCKINMKLTSRVRFYEHFCLLLPLNSCKQASKSVFRKHLTLIIAKVFL